jgi:hypothetical protein
LVTISKVSWPLDCDSDVNLPVHGLLILKIGVQEREEPTLTEWDRFAHTEYIRLSMEEDGEDASNGSAEVWDEPFEAPF